MDKTQHIYDKWKEYDGKNMKNKQGYGNKI